MLHFCSNYTYSASKKYSCPLQLLCSCTTRIWNITYALSACPIKPVFLHFPRDTLQSDKHHSLFSSWCSLCHHAIVQSSNSKSCLGKEVTAGHCAHWADIAFPSPPPCQQQLMTAAILKIKQEMISIGDVVAHREKWGRSEVLLFFHVSTGALQKGCKGTNVCAAFHVAEGPAPVFVVAAAEAHCGGCPCDPGSSTAGRGVTAFCWSCVVPRCCWHTLAKGEGIAQWSGLSLGHCDNPLTSTPEYFLALSAAGLAVLWPVNNSLAHHIPVWDIVLVSYLKETPT